MQPPRRNRPPYDRPSACDAWNMDIPLEELEEDD